MTRASLPFSEIPFSRCGSYFAVSKESDGEIYLRDLHGGDMAPSKLYRIDFKEDNPADIRADMSENRLILRSRTGECLISMDACDTVYIFCDHIAVGLVAAEARYDSLIPLGDAQWEHQFYSKNIKVRVAGEGNVAAESIWRVSESESARILIDGRERPALCSLHSYRVVPQDTCPLSPDCAERAAAETAAAYRMWRGETEPSGDETERIANYILWSNFVHAGGCLRYDAMYMNKLAMGNIWSWDNCFGAIALAAEHPREALEQLLVVTDHQDESGALPDYVNDMFASYSCLKPPIYGFTIEKLREKNEFFRSLHVSEILYDSVSKLTNFWLDHRVDERLELPCYYHGNDSGWDNASVFHAGVPVCTPDISAFLILQMDVLSDLAAELQRENEASVWKERADGLQARLLDKLYSGDRFVSRLCRDGSTDSTARSLLDMLPVVIGYRLPGEIIEKIVGFLERDFERAFGLATECPDSRYYRKGGYWLGPVWAPVSYLFIEALKRAGYAETARRLAEKFLRLPLVGGMAENFDPMTGEGYDDNAFAWTASVYLLLKEEFSSIGKGGILCENDD